MTGVPPLIVSSTTIQASRAIRYRSARSMTSPTMRPTSISTAGVSSSRAVRIWAVLMWASLLIKCFLCAFVRFRSNLVMRVAYATAWIGSIRREWRLRPRAVRKRTFNTRSSMAFSMTRLGTRESSATSRGVNIAASVISRSFRGTTLSHAATKCKSRQAGPGEAPVRPGLRFRYSCHLINVDRRARAFDSRRPQRLEREIAFDQLAQSPADRDRTRTRQRLQPRRQAGRMANRRVLGVLPRLDRPHHHLAAVRPYPHLQIKTFLRPQPLGHLHRALHIGEQHRDLLALAFQRRLRLQNLVGEKLGRIRARTLGKVVSCWVWGCSGCPSTAQLRAAFAAVLFRRLVLGAARRTYWLQRRPALRAELPPCPIIGPAVRTAHAPPGPATIRLIRPARPWRL